MSENWSDMEEPVREVEPPPAPEQVGPRPARYQQTVMFEEEPHASPPASRLNAETQRAQRSSGDRGKGRISTDAAGTAAVAGGDRNAQSIRARNAGAQGDGETYYRPLIERAGELVQERARDDAPPAGAAYLAPSVLDDEIIADDMGAADGDVAADEVVYAQGGTGDNGAGADADDIGLEGRRRCRRWRQRLALKNGRGG